MTADGMALPSVSSLLQWARLAREAEPDGQSNNAPSSPSKRWFSDVGTASTVPEPLTPDIIQRASTELPQGASVALESCLTAFKSHRLSEAEFLTFARTLVSQSPSLAAAFGPEASSSQAIHVQSGQFAPSSYLDRLDAKRQRFGKCSDLILTAHALMTLNKANHQTAVWNLFSQAPSLNNTLPAAIEQGQRGPAPQSASSTPSPHIHSIPSCGLQPIYAPGDMAQALASLSEAQSQAQNLPLKKESSSSTASDGLEGSSSSSPSTPPSHPVPDDKAPGSLKRGAAHVVLEGVPKGLVCSGVGIQGRWQGVASSAAAALTGSGTPQRQLPEDGSAHNKYCHFCQHIKVKRASSMIACENRGCNRRFCEHCLNTHITDQSYTLQWKRSGLPWHCPICTKTCCCTLRECGKQHRHCKAYRYRRKRAAQAETDIPDKPAGPTRSDSRSNDAPPSAATAGMPFDMLMQRPPHAAAAASAAVASATAMYAMLGTQVAGNLQQPAHPHTFTRRAAAATAGDVAAAHMFFQVSN